MEDNIPDDDSLLDVASKIDDDQAIDWDAEAGAVPSDSERAVLAELRLLAALTRVYRNPDGPGGETIALPAGAAAPPDVSLHTWGPLTILEPVGKGVSARVYRARDNLGRDVAVKLFPITGENSGALAAHVLREGSLLAKVKHRNVVTVHGVQRIGDYVGLWMEFINGRTMEEELRKRGSLSAEEATLIGVDLCQALAAVHACGLVHRDVKAQNVMRQEGGRTVLMDFGAGAELTAGAGSHELAGTPLYLAPEIYNRQQATRASDIYSLGVLLYRMVTDTYPVDGLDRHEIERAHRSQKTRRLRDVRPDLPGAFIQAVERALSPDPQLRYQTAGEFEAALTGRVKTDPAPVWTWTGRAAAIAAALVVVAIPIGWLLSNRSAVSDTTGSQSIPPPPAAVEKPATDAAAGVEYTVRATLVRDRNGRETPLEYGARLTPGDALAMRVEASTDVYVYLVNADEVGDSYRLFPLPNHQPDNPLPASRTHRLPGPDVNWKVTSEGLRERFVLVVSPTFPKEIDSILRLLPTPQEETAIVRGRIPDNDIGVLRGVGGLASRKVDAGGEATKLPWFEGAEPLRNVTETARGPWVRQAVFDNAGGR